MKCLLLICYLVICPLYSIAQNDSAVIRNVFNYINTPAFKTTCRDSALSAYKKGNKSITVSGRNLHSFNKRFIADTVYLGDVFCYEPYQYYYKTIAATTLKVPASVKGNNALFVTDTLYLPFTTPPCNNSIVLTVTCMPQNEIWLRHYSLPYMYARSVKFGQSEVIKLTVDKNNTVLFVGYQMEMNN